MEDSLPGLIKSLGPSAIVAIVLWVMLQRAEKREDKKDAKIQYLEDRLIENYSERIAYADVVAEALRENARSLDGLVREIRIESGRNV